ncbi:MAG TPA: acetyl-CoA carboxylase biotin carboxyl carrier protein subunit, partial [Pseudothermotoga sp.]|nr:acetyl-CoA carboxylase biotin carboxyl carrier protein subunit [Pseudothermotoga sp.]
MARKFRVVVNGKEYIVEVEEIGLSGVQQPII